MSINGFHKSCKQLDGGIDQGLTNYIVETNSIRALADFNSQAAIAVGLKGIGKSSAYRFLTEVEKSADVIVGINTDNYVLHLPQRNYGISVFRKRFERDLLFEALREVVNQSDALKNRLDGNLLTDARKTINSFLDKLKSAGKKIVGVGFSVVGVGFTLQKDSPTEQEGLIPEQDISKARTILTNICKKGIKIRIVIDDPEEVLSLGTGLDIQMLGGFCLASLRLSSTIPGLKIVGLLKTHVYHPVNKYVEDLSKYPDHATHLAWSREELKTMIKDRLRATSTGIGEVFFGSSEDLQLKILENMIRSVRNGPRDLLRWIDLALSKNGEQPIRPEDVKLVLEDMSQNSFEEFARAYSTSYENMHLLVKAIFVKKARIKFTHAELRKHLQDLYVRDVTIRTLRNYEWFQREFSGKIPQLLFETGSIAFIWQKQTVLPYQKEYSQRNFEKATSVFLNPAFVPAVSEQSKQRSPERLSTR